MSRVKICWHCREEWGENHDDQCSHCHSARWVMVEDKLQFDPHRHSSREPRESTVAFGSTVSVLKTEQTITGQCGLDTRAQFGKI